MTRAASWSIKGVGFDARQAAQEAARRAGVSVGDWINEVIAEQAAEMGVDVEDFGDDDRIEAVTGRLSRMSGREDGDNRRWREKRGDERDFDDRRPRRARRPARSLRAADAERLLENAVDAFERRSARASSRTAAALADVASRLGDLEARLDDQGEESRDDSQIRESLDRLEQRMETLSRRAARPEREEPDAGLRDHVDGALRDIGARLDHVMDRLDRPQERKPDRAAQQERAQVDATLRDLGARLDHVVARLDRPRAAPRDPAQDRAIEAIERKLAAVLDAVNRPQPRPAPAAASPVALSTAPALSSARPRVGRAPVSDLVAEIERRQRDLDEPARSHRRPPAPPASLSPDQLDARLDLLAERFERVAVDAAKRAAQEASERAAQEAAAARAAQQASLAAAQEAAARFEKAAADQAARAAAVARAEKEASDQAMRLAREAAARAAQDAALIAAQEAASRVARETAARSPVPQIEPMMRGLQDEVGRLAVRLEEMRKSAAARPADAVGAQEVEAVRREIAGIARSIHDLDARQPIAQLERAVRDLARRVETSRADGAPDAVTAPLARFADEMRAALGAIDPRPGFAAIETALTDVARRFDGATQRTGGVDASELAALRAQNAEIRALVDAALARPAMSDRVERQIAQLGERLDRLTFAPAHVSPPEIAQAIGEIRAMMAAAVPSGSLDSLETRISALTDEIARWGETRLAAPAASQIVPEALDKRLVALAEKMDRLGGAGTDAPRLTHALDEIRALVGSAAPAGAIQALERQIGGLAGRLDRVLAADPQNEGLGEALGEIRALMSEGAGAKARENQALERQIAGLADRLDRFASARVVEHADGPGAPDAVAEAMSGAMRELRQMMAGGDTAIAALERRVADLADRIGAAPAPATPDLGLLAEEVARRVRGESEDEIYSGVTPHQDQALRELLADISERVSEIRRPGLQDETLHALRAEIGRLAERLDKAENGTTDVSTLSGAVSSLMDRIDQMRESAAETAHEAARAALREAMDQGLGEAAPASREIEELKARQGEAERRSNATLGAVHDTLEKIVDRLAQIEDEVDVRPMAQAAPARHVPLARAVPDDGYGDEPLGLGQSQAYGAPAARAGARSGPAPVPSAVSALAEDLLIDPSEGRGRPVDEAPERRDAAAFIAAARRMTQQNAVEAPEPPAGIATRAALAAQAARDAILAKTLKGEAPQQDAGKAEVVKAKADKAKPEKAKAEKAKPVSIFPDDDDEDGAREVQPKASRLRALKRPVLIGLIGLTLALGALMYMNFEPGGAKLSGATLEPGSAPVAIDAQKSPRITLDAPAKGSSEKIDANRPSGADPQAADGAPPRGEAAAVAPAPGSAAIPPAGAMSPPAAPGPQAAAADATTTSTLGPAGPLVGPKALREAASAGDSAAEYETAMRLLDGRGGAAKDAKSAALWLERAAARGLAPAQYRLGALYEKGVGATRDAAQARKWYLRAAEAGNARAMHNLAVLTAEGADDKPDYRAAAQWFIKAAELGVRDSQYNLAILYARGLGVEQNLALSYTWFATAAKQGDEDSARKRDEIAAKLDAKLLAQAKQAAELFRAKSLDRAANEVAPPPGGWEKGEGGPYGGVGVRSIGRPRAG